MNPRHHIIHALHDPSKVGIGLVRILVLLRSRTVVDGIVLDGNVPARTRRPTAVAYRALAMREFLGVFLEWQVLLDGARSRGGLQDVTGVAMELAAHPRASDLQEGVDGDRDEVYGRHLDDDLTVLALLGEIWDGGWELEADLDPVGGVLTVLGDDDLPGSVLQLLRDLQRVLVALHDDSRLLDLPHFCIQRIHLLFQFFEFGAADRCSIALCHGIAAHGAIRGQRRACDGTRRFILLCEEEASDRDAQQHNDKDVPP
mmetsp:Transcript_5045/g.13416  ORF Transcript_5045/g.13416 Transcript_5045/m.13416 type:complete len:258 (+) Transcript_5045:1061-1834(+)